jgi:hypothetical protein
MNRLILSGIFTVCLAPAAFAQKDMTGNVFFAVAKPCEDAVAKNAKPQAIVTACEKADRDLAAARVKAGLANLSPHATNMYLLKRKATAWSTATAYGDIDGGLTKRVCDTLETGWGYGQQLVPENSPADQAPLLNETKWSGATAVLNCRKGFGAPPGAAPVTLPPLKPSKPKP